ncbi:MAG: glucosamine-6-phosphate deaminase [Planctomycetota bacterium]
MRLVIEPDRDSLGKFVAKRAADILAATIRERGEARIVVATGSSQFEVMHHLAQSSEVDWTKVDGFHLDEYVGLGDGHPASFCRYLRERFVEVVKPRSFHYLRGDLAVDEVIDQANAAVRSKPIDLALIGIGENGHLAFNDPPADFELTDAYHLVTLDEACRRQQVGEGWFESMDDVPKTAISMTVHQILQSRQILCTVPDERKAEAVERTLNGSYSPNHPSTSLRHHDNTILAIDRAAASKLDDETRSRFIEPDRR